MNAKSDTEQQTCPDHGKKGGGAVSMIADTEQQTCPDHEDEVGINQFKS